jgi:hypothetical protein
MFHCRVAMACSVDQVILRRNTPQAILLSLRKHMVEWSKMRKKLKTWLKDNPQVKKKTGGAASDYPFSIDQAKNQMFSQLDSLERNPYMSTAVDRIQKTGQPFKRKK